MNKLFAITLVALTLALVNCKDKTTDEPDPTPAKTLNKSLMTNKYWKATLSSGSISHYFGSDGKIYLPDGTTERGTWQWLNNSDSLEKVDVTFGRSVLYVEYCTETEMKAKISSKGSWDIYTKQ